MGKRQQPKKKVYKKANNKKKYAGVICRDPEKLKLSACMMVKNEAKDLPRCLKSLLRHCDEIIVLDTGSTDETPSIAESFGCKVFYLDNPDDYFIETRFGRYINFSKARNKSMQYATGDWVLIIDADEVMEWGVVEPENFKAYLAALPKRVAAINIDLSDQQQGGNAMMMLTSRIFRKDRVYYKHIVHNKAIANGMAHLLTGITLHHYGYDYSDDPEKKQRKLERSTGLLEIRVEKNPDDYEAWFYLSQQYIMSGDDDKGLEACDKYISYKKLAEKQLNFNASIYYTASKTLMKHGKYNEANKWISDGLKNNDKDMDLSYALLQFGVGVKNNALVLKGAEQFVACYYKFSEDPKFNYGKFNLTFNPACLAHALQALSMARLNSGIEALVQLDRQMLQLDSARKSRIYTGLVQDLDMAGIGSLIKVMSEDKIIHQQL